MDCLFCKIAEKKIPSNIVFESRNIIAFHDVTPQAPVHILIIPKKHIESLNDITPGDNHLLGEIQNTIKELAKQVTVSQQGYRVVVNCGPAAGQAVAHLHYHLLGGRKFSWPPG